MKCIIYCKTIKHVCINWWKHDISFKAIVRLRNSGTSVQWRKIISLVDGCWLLLVSDSHTKCYRYFIFVWIIINNNNFMFKIQESHILW